MPTFGGGDLALQLAVALQSIWIEGSGHQSRLNRATGFGLVEAVIEVARGGNLGNVGKRGIDTPVVLDQTQLPHAGRVDEHSPTRQGHEFAPRRRVPASRIVFPDAAHVLNLAAHELVDQGRLADP